MKTFNMNKTRAKIVGLKWRIKNNYFNGKFPITTSINICTLKRTKTRAKIVGVNWRIKNNQYLVLNLFFTTRIKGKLKKILGQEPKF